MSSGFASCSRWQDAPGTPAGLRFGRDLGQPDGGLNGFNLTEERPDAAEFVSAPMLEKARGFGVTCHSFGFGQRRH